MTEQPEIAEPEQLSQVANIRQQFEQRGFRFTDGKLGERPRHFGVTKHCTLELVGEAAVEQATMVAVMAHDAENTARLNGFRLAALLALLAGEEGVKWVGGAMKRAQTMPGQKPKVESVVGGWKLALTVNRQKSVVTLKAWGKR